MLIQYRQVSVICVLHPHAGLWLCLSRIWLMSCLGTFSASVTANSVIDLLLSGIISKLDTVYLAVAPS